MGEKVENIEMIDNELSPEFLGVVGLNNFPGGVSGSRMYMFCSHIGQTLVVNGATTKRLLTGMEQEYGKYLHDIRFDCNARIIAVVQKYREVPGYVVVHDNPTTVVIYEDVDSDDRRIGIMYLEKFHNIHQYFGFNYVYTQNARRLVAEALIEKGAVVATSPNLTADGNYRFGIGANVALMSTPAVTEDGIVVSKSYLKKMASKGYGTRTISWGRSGLPLNLHGDDSSYKVLPDIGRRVDGTGLLCATRHYNPNLVTALFSKKALKLVDFMDRTVYVPPNSKIVDIIVHRGGKDRNHLPNMMTEQLQFYHEKNVEFHKQLLDTYEGLVRETRGNLKLTPELSRQIAESKAITAIADRKLGITPMMNRQVLDDWHVTVVFEYDIIPTIGFKITGMHGNKGVICDVWDDEDMPVDAAGNRAEIIMDAQSIFKRMNPAVYYEQYINASGKATADRVAAALDSGTPVENIWEYLLGFYKTVSPYMYEMIAADPEYVSEKARLKHLKDVVKEGMFVFLPTNNPVSITDVVRGLINNYPATYGPIVYKGRSGRIVKTVGNILIGEMYILVLEKIGNTWSAVSSSKCTPYGIPARLNNSDKYANPGRHNPTRCIGESEARALEAFCSLGEHEEVGIAAEILDQNNNPLAHEFIVQKILLAEKPTNIEKVIDRNVVPYGGGRIVTTINHTMQCGGARFVWRDEKE